MILSHVVAISVFNLTGPQLELCVIILAASVLIATNAMRADKVALLVFLALGLGRVLTPEQALSGFSQPAIITIIGLFIISGALERTGVIQWVADRLSIIAGQSETRLMIVLMITGAVLSLAMNNIAAGAVLLPAAIAVARQHNVAPSKVLMPLAFGTLLGGMATLFTTANIIVSGSLHSMGLPPLTMMDFLPAGG
ncbi:MAG TPA: SLC13 family permease, partial [Blastocatellia bacterium]|nr:SLC13 family permease [Blastocatellia bacterium]